MENNYFETLKNAVQEPEQPNTNPVESSGMATLTVKVDIDCKLLCDGDFLDFFEANKVKKITVQTGWHLFTIESAQFSEVTEDHEIDVAEAGKNYPLLVKGLKQKEDTMIQKAEEETRRKAEDEARRKMEEENLRLAQASRKNDTVFKISFCLPPNKLRETLHKLFSTALTDGNSDYDKDFWESLAHDKQQGNRYEDRLLDCLLNGGTIHIYDDQADGELYGAKGVILKDGRGMYTVTLKDIIDGLQRAADGSFKFEDDSEKKEVKDAFLSLMKDVFLPEFFAIPLIQVILFNELIYEY